MSEAEIFIKHLRELEYVIEEEAPGHPRAWTVLTNMRQLVGPFYTLESGRILQLASPLLRIAQDVFGPDWKTLAMICGGQAPTIGRVVHVWYNEVRFTEPPELWRQRPVAASTPRPAMISFVYDDGTIDLEEGSRNDHIPYNTFSLGWPVSYWTWPRIVR